MAMSGAGGGRDSQWSSRWWCCPALVVTALPYVAPSAAVPSPETRQEARAKAVEAVWAAEAVRAADSRWAAAGSRWEEVSVGMLTVPCREQGELEGNRHPEAVRKKKVAEEGREKSFIFFLPRLQEGQGL